MKRHWVDEHLLDGPEDEIVLRLGTPVDRRTLRDEVARQVKALSSIGVGTRGTVALRLPPSIAYIASLLAAWKLDAQVILLDYRLTDHEVQRALDHLAPQAMVEAGGPIAGRLSGWFAVSAEASARPGQPAATEHVLVQLSSGSTGPSKVVGRTAESLVAEIERYTGIPGMPRPGERLVICNSLIHTFGLIGGLLYCLNVGVELVAPDRITADGIVAAVASATAPTTLFGVPFHYELLTASAAPVAVPQLVHAVTGGELIRPEIPEAFQARFGVPLGECYGMTEIGVIAMDVAAEYRPAHGPPAPGIRVRMEDGELLVGAPESPYLGLVDPDRWSQGWLRTRDAAAIDEESGVVAVHGRRDSQVAIGGLKVDLNEVEHTLAGLPGVVEAVVVHDGRIQAYLVLAESATVEEVDAELVRLLAPFKRPGVLHPVEALPRTATGKRIRDLSALRAAVTGGPA